MTLRTTKISLGVLGLVFAAAALLSLVSSKPVYSQATCSTRRVSVNGSTTNGTTNVIANATTFTVSLSGYTPGPGAYFYASGGSTMNAMTHVSGSINGGSYRTLETGRFQIRAGGLWTETATGALCDADGDHYFSFTYYQYVISQGLTFSVVANDSVNKPNAHTFTVDVIQVPDWTGINRGWNFGAVTLTARTTSNISVTPQSVTPGLGRAVTIPTSGTSGTYPKVEQIWFQLYSGATLIAESLLDGISPQGPVLTINDPSGVIIGCPAAQPLLVSSGNLNGGSSITVRSPAGYTYAGTDAFSIASGAASAGNSTTTLSSPENSYTSATISSSSVSGGTVVIRPKAGVWSYASLSGSAANCNLADQSVTLSGFNVQNYGVQTTVQGSGYSYITVTINNDGNYTAPITTTFTTSNGPAGSALCDSANSNCNPGSTGQTFTFSGSYKDVKLRVPNTSTGTYNYSVTATGAGGVTFSRNYTVTVTSLQMTTSFTVNGVVIASNNTSA
ncbi:MAG TPA: hypothetical protein VEA59_06120, partial [Patescibacteria group bacterium]|nr:hypothetical protein [Patescibacteria group bacterium]